MIVLLALAFPLVLLGLLLAMERVENPLRDAAAPERPASELATGG